MPSYYRVKHIGKLASDLLIPGIQGSILATVSHAIYLVLENNQGEIIWLIDEMVPLHRRGLQVIGALPRLSVGATFTIEERTLITEGIRVDFSNATLWESRDSILDKILHDDLLIRVRELAISLLQTTNPSGFGVIISGLLDVKSESLPLFEDKPLAMLPPLAQTAIQELLMAIAEGNDSVVWEKAQSLLGLGPGLTPSGDDFVGGVLFGTCILNRIYPTVMPLRLTKGENFLTYARSSTNPISFTLLKDHALGHSIEPLHQLAHGLLKGQTLETLLEITRQLTQIGHSTGWDILAGFMAVFLLVLSRMQVPFMNPYQSTRTDENHIEKKG